MIWAWLGLALLGWGILHFEFPLVLVQFRESLCAIFAGALFGSFDEIWEGEKHR